MKANKFYLLSFLFIFTILVQSSFANVIVFSEYQTKASLDGDFLKIEKELTLKNVGRSPIIPGELHFRMYQEEGKNEKASLITGYSAKGHYDDELKIKKYEQGDQTELVVDIWEPLLPGFTYRFKLNYDIEFSPKGILFYDLVLPEEKTTIPIKNQLYELTVPENKHITYAAGAVVSDNKAVWRNVASPQLEYSMLPLPMLPIKGVNVFWVTVILILCVLLVSKVMKAGSRR